MKIAENSCLLLKCCGVGFGFWLGVFLVEGCLVWFFNVNKRSHKVTFVIFFLFLLSVFGAGQQKL